MTKFYECCLCDGLIDHHKNAKGETYWTKGHNAQQRSNQHKRKHNPKSNHFNGLIIGKRSRYNGGLLNAFKK